MSYVNKCYEDFCGIYAPHYHYEWGHKRLFNFEQYGCPANNNGTHSIIPTYTRSWKTFWLKKYNWIRCFNCNGKWRTY